MRIETIRLWEGRDDVELTMFLNLDDPFLKIKRKRPAIISVPGGAYQTCPRDGHEGDPVAMAFAIDGYQGFVLEYLQGVNMFPNTYHVETVAVLKK